MNHHLQSSATSTPPVFPSRPRLVLRVGFAGSQRLVTDQELDAQTLPDDEMARTQEQANRVAARAERRRLERALSHVLEALGHTLAAIAPRASVTQVRESRVDGFYSSQCPLLRLVTGLCEGADALAAQLLDRVNIATDSNDTCGANARCLETELAAVIPFAVETYRRSRPDSFQGEFDRQLASCAWVLELDGIYEKPVSDTTEAKKRRARVYRAQSSFLLRQSDILIAAANPDRPSKPGGTLETVREALAFGLPIAIGGTTAPWTIATLPSVCAECTTCHWPAATSRLPPRRHSSRPESSARAPWTGCSTRSSAPSLPPTCPMRTQRRYQPTTARER
jgi:hypothetical protein